MHELSIALSILEGAAEEVERQGGGRVYAIHLKLGPLSGVIKDALNFSYDLACEGTPFEGSRLVIQEIPVVIFCPACRAERPLGSTQNFCCPVCGVATPDVVRGRELEIAGLEMDA
ncbi:MAG: hydrogenase maturation nickel metallochaperone HypA [Acidobacteriota bacterium]|nr:hydrogenase maturation nickel metallochaperone HypA [Acidobacteriota bacterium]